MRSNKQEEAEEFVMVCGDREFSVEVREEWRQRHCPIRLEFVDGWKPARNLLKARTPAVILFKEQAGAPCAGAAREKTQSLTAMVTLFADHAPTVVVGSAGQQAGLQALLAGGTVDFVARALGCLPLALGLVERRLRRSNGRKTALLAQPLLMEGPSADLEARDFGEILRHELNNPLTGILGNAELLLVELRRNKVPLPPQTERRLETIAALAVRMRETVRRLSDEWEAQSEAMTRELAQSPN
jgi:signal transduction histidine kinase